MFIQRQYNNQCCEHSLRALCTPYIDFNCPEYDRLGASIGGWRNKEVADIPSYVNRLFRCRSLQNKHIAHWSEKIDGQKYAAFFAKDGISIWNDAYGEKLLGFICYTYGRPGHFTVLRPYYYATGWKWYYLDSCDRRRFDDADDFDFKRMKELSIAQCIHLVNTFNIQYTQDRSDGRCNSMHAFTLPTNVEERPYLVDGRSAATATDLRE